MKIVVTDETGIVLLEKSKKGGSNNIAELWAVAETMLFARSCGIPEVHIYTDSKNTKAWLQGRIGKKLNDRVSVETLLTCIQNVAGTIPFDYHMDCPESESCRHLYRNWPCCSLDVHCAFAEARPIVWTPKTHT